MALQRISFNAFVYGKLAKLKCSRTALSHTYTMLPHYLGGPSAAAAAAAVAATQSCRFQWPFKLCIECALKCATGPLRAVRNLTKNTERRWELEGGRGHSFAKGSQRS